MTRDSLALWFAAGIALVGYLMTADRPVPQWGYNDWLQFASFALVWGAGKLATSPLPGEHDADRLTR